MNKPITSLTVFLILQVGACDFQTHATLERRGGGIDQPQAQLPEQDPSAVVTGESEKLLGELQEKVENEVLPAMPEDQQAAYFDAQAESVAEPDAELTVIDVENQDVKLCKKWDLDNSGYATSFESTIVFSAYAGCQADMSSNAERCPRADLDSSGEVNFTDLVAYAQRKSDVTEHRCTELQDPLYANCRVLDRDGDEKVAGLESILFLAHYQECQAQPRATGDCTHTDLNRDGHTDFSDLVQYAQNYTGQDLNCRQLYQRWKSYPVSAFKEE